MQLSTLQKVFYGHQITLQNCKIDFNDGSNKVVTLALGRYSPTELAAEIVKKMNAASSIDFTVSFDRATRLFTISGTSAFSLLVATGANIGSGAFGLLGFIGADRTSATTHAGNALSGSVYSSQFPIQSYKKPETNRFAIEPVVNRATSGVSEIIKFGDESFLEGEFAFITDEIQESGSAFRTNPNGVSDFVNLMNYLTEGGHVEFCENENDVSNFYTLELRSTTSSPQGLDYDLVELYDRGLPNYFRSGVLKFKSI